MKDKQTIDVLMKRNAATDQTLVTGNAIAKKFGMTKWDYIIAGDGSATTWDNTGGYGSILYSRGLKERRFFYGGFSNGTNNAAELMAVIHPLLYLDGAVKTKYVTPIVFVLSDSAYVVNGGNGQNEQKSNRALWSAIADLQQRFMISFRHVPRMILPANVFGDSVGNAVRTTLDKIRF